MNARKPVPLIVPLLLLSLLALIAGLWAGLLRLGWQIPGAAPLALDHGPLMVSGFLGTLIILERVVAIRQGWMYAAPLASGLGWALTLALPGSPAGPILITLGSLGAVAVLSVMVRREPKIHTWVMALGALSWLVGNLFWLAGWPVFHLVLWWMAFLVLTVAGERLELSRVLRPTRRQVILFGLAVAIFLGGVALAVFLPDPGTRLAGFGLLALAAWLARYDIARRNLRHKVPLTRYIAGCLFAGYVWLAVGGIIAMAVGAQPGGAYYDALLHSVFLGFVFSMIFGHAPIILPALTGLPVTFRPVYYLHLGLLHLSLVLRIAGDLLGWALGRKWGGLINEVAVLLFFGVTLFTLLGERRQRARAARARREASTGV